MTPLRGDELREAVEARLQVGPTVGTDGANVCVVVPDATRPLPVEPTVGPLVRSLIEAGADVQILVGLGLHRPMTGAELADLVAVADRFGIELAQHDADGDEIVELGEVDGLPPAAPSDLSVTLNRRVLEADRVVCVGTVEPHQYAGYSGGIKAVSIGCAGERTISAMHGLQLLRDERTTLGAVQDNPFQQTLWRIAGALDGVVGLQVVPSAGGGVEQVVFDEIGAAFERAYSVAASRFFEAIEGAPLDWLHLGVPESKAANFYQASRAATYVALVDRPAVRQGGLIVVEADCPEGIGTGDGEQACAEAMARGRPALLAELEGKGDIETRGGQQRAYVLARACRRNDVAVVGAPEIEGLEPMGIGQFETVGEALAAHGVAGGRGRRIDDVFHRVPKLAGD